MAYKLSQMVRTKQGEVTTIAALLDSGLAKVEKVDNFVTTSKSKPRTAYFATMTDGGCWEIGKLAYASRVGATKEEIMEKYLGLASFE